MMIYLRVDEVSLLISQNVHHLLCFLGGFVSVFTSIAGI